MEDKIYYNAIAIGTGGNYADIAIWAARLGTWKEKFIAFRQSGFSGSSIDPEAEWKKTEKLGLNLILIGDPDYPPLLREISQPPFGIYVLGHGPLAIGNSALAIVGTRRATPDGKSTAKRFARELAAAGFTIASGLAFGIDAAAHEGCLEGGGRTVAVLAGGLDGVYPRSNHTLAEKILARGGALISEYPIGQPPHASRFLERNRVVSGLSRGTLVIEAPEKSGSLVTARHAFEQNRNLFVVPGPITHRNFKASHELIRQGAELVAEPRHIMEAYGVSATSNLSLPTSNLSTEEKLILSALQVLGEPAEVDKLADITKLEPRIVNQTITFLLIRHLVKETENGYIMN
ncbi:MAG: DNA-processing protein DprA [Patescibacteria group bacterium]|nr:DNA-processing protein DprA [Patescibacteria group bacterium]